MKKLSTALALSAASLAVAAPAQAHRNCQRLYTVAQGKHTALSVFHGTRAVHLEQFKLLGYIERCQRNPRAQGYMRWYDRHQRALHRQRVLAARHPEYYSTASWYYDQGSTASGWHATYGVANRTMPFGTRITFYYGGRSVQAVVDDRGPYVSGRDFDLSQNTARALGFQGVATVGWRYG